MKNLVKMIKSAYDEEKLNAEYLLQLNKVVELEDKFIKEFGKEKWKEYFELEIRKRSTSKC